MELVKKTRTLRLPARASVWYIAAAVLGRGIGVFGTPIFTRLLTAAEYGLFPLYNTWLSIATVIATLEIAGGCTLRALQKYENRRSELLSGALGVISAVFVTICIIYFCAFRFINRLTGLSVPITAVMLAQIYINAVINLYTAGARYSYSYKRVAAINTVAAFLSPIISIAIITLTPFHAQGRIFGGAIATALIALPLFITILKGSRRLFNPEIWRYLLSMAIPLLPHYLSVAAILRIGEITVGRIHGTAALGKYSVALSLGLSVSVITGGLLSAIGPWVLRHIKTGDFDRIRKTLFLITKGLCLFALLLLSVVPETIKILTPTEYHSALSAVYPLVLSSVPSFLSSVITQGQMYYERTFYTSLPSVSAAAVSTIFSLMLLPRIRWQFVSLFVMLAYITLFAVSCIIFKRLSGKMPIDFKRSCAVYLATLLYAALILLLRENTLSRIILAIPLLPLLLSVGFEAFSAIKEPRAEY